MDPAEIVKYGAEIAKAGALAAGAAIPFTGIIKSILGPASDEIAERFRDEIRLYRFSRQVKLLKKAEAIAHEAGFAPKAVPIKILFPLLEGASLEENEDLHDMWAALLANASNESASDLVRPSFCELLKIMAPDVAKLLNLYFDQALTKLQRPPSRTFEDLGIDAGPPMASNVIGEIQAMTQVDLGTYRHLYRRFLGMPEGKTESPVEEAEWENDASDRHKFAVAMDELQRMEMWSLATKRSSGDHYYLSALAAQFVTVCRRPRKSGLEAGAR